MKNVCKSFTHLVVCLTTGPKPLPKPALHIVRSRASSFKWEYPLLYLRSSSSFFYYICGSVHHQIIWLTLNIPRGVLRGPPLVCYWLTSVEINKHKIFDTNNVWITELYFQKPKKHNLSNLPHQTVEKLQKKKHGVLRGPQLGKQRWWRRLGILRVK